MSLNEAFERGAAMRSRTRQRGATAVEYAIMLGGIAMVIIAAVVLFGKSVQASFEDSGDQIAAARGNE